VSLRPLALVATALVVVGILENLFFGADSGGAKHYISVGFFFLTLLGIVALVALGIVAVVRRVRTTA
jgi:uncharacterized membrane protein